MFTVHSGSKENESASMSDNEVTMGPLARSVEQTILEGSSVADHVDMRDYLGASDGNRRHTELGEISWSIIRLS